MATITSRRRAEAFATLVEQPTARHGPDAGRDAALLDVVTGLRAQPEIAPRPEFSAALRHELMTRAVAAAPATTQPGQPDTRRRDRRIGVVVGGLVIAGATSSVGMAAQTALPGDGLYPIKIAIDEGRTVLARSDADRGRALLAQASDRLGEVSDLTVRGGPTDAQAVSATLDRFTSRADEGGRLLLADYRDTGADASAQQVRSFVATSMETLGTLEATAPPAARAELLSAAESLRELDALADQACPACGGPVAAVPTELTRAAPVLLPQLPPLDTRPPTPADQPAASDPRLPDVRPEQLPPGSVTPRDPAPRNDGGSTTPQPTDPVADLTRDLTVTLPQVGPVPETDLGDLLRDPVGTVDSTVKGTTGSLNDTLDDTLGTGGLTEPLLGSNKD